MVHLVPLAALLLLPSILLAQDAAGPAKDPSARERFLACFKARDEAACLDLWRHEPHDVLEAIDADLEGALALWEKSPEQPDAAAIQELHTRALWGAALASKAGHPIFLDYAAAFVGFDAAQKKRFRAGQRAHGEARAALKAKDFALAQQKARECIDHAAPLGDWWGHAMGLAALGAAFAADDNHGAAIAPLGEAALVYRDLQLASAELGVLRTLAASLVATGAKERAKVVLGRAIDVAEALGDTKSKQALSEQLRVVRG